MYLKIKFNHKIFISLNMKTNNQILRSKNLIKYHKINFKTNLNIIIHQDNMILSYHNHQQDKVNK